MFDKEKVKSKWFRVIESISPSRIKLPKEMIEILCYYAEYESIKENTNSLYSGSMDKSMLPDLLKGVMNNYQNDNSKKLEIKKTLFDTAINTICYELSDGTIRYPGDYPVLGNIYDIYKYFPEDFIKYIDPQFHREKQIDKII